MKRLLLPASALALVLTACGAGAKPEPQATDVGSRRRPVHAIAAARRAAASREAERLLSRLELPAGSRPSKEPEALSHGNLGVSVLTEFAYRHRFWRTHEPLHEVVRFLERHPPPGFELGGSGSPPVSLEFDRPPVGGHPMQRLLDVELATQSGWTYIRADLGVAWIYPRSPREVVPPGVHEIDIRAENVASRVTDPAQVRRIVRWFDRLNVVQPGPVVSCALVLAAKVTFVFRSIGQAELASAVVPSQPADGCNPISFAIAGKRQTPLIDARIGKYAFVNRVQRLLGVCFRDPTRACRR